MERHVTFALLDSLVMLSREKIVRVVYATVVEWINVIIIMASVNVNQMLLVINATVARKIIMDLIHVMDARLVIVDQLQRVRNVTWSLDNVDANLESREENVTSVSMDIGIMDQKDASVSFF